jgi:hypothetical protein
MAPGWQIDGEPGDEVNVFGSRSISSAKTVPERRKVINRGENLKKFTHVPRLTGIETTMRRSWALTGGQEERWG